jgi:hypothetical protein
LLVNRPPEEAAQKVTHRSANFWKCKEKLKKYFWRLLSQIATFGEAMQSYI